MSEQTSKVFVTPHNQAFAKGDVLKLEGGYWRVLGCKDDKPYATLLFLGYYNPNSSSAQSTAYPAGVGDYGHHVWMNDFNYTNPHTGDATTGKVAYYNKDIEPKATLGYTADEKCTEFKNNKSNEFVMALSSMSMPAQNVYFSPAYGVSATIGTPNVIINKDSRLYERCVKQIGVSDQTWQYTRSCRCLSISDIISYFNTGEITSKQLADDLLGGKHYGDRGWSVVVEGLLYDGAEDINEGSPSQPGNGSYISFYNTDKTNEWYGSYINWDPLNTYQGNRDQILPIVELNLRNYRYWEKATDW